MKVRVLVAQSRQTLRPHRLQPTRLLLLSIGVSRQEYWSVQPFSSTGDLPDPGIEPGLLHCRWILYHLCHQRFNPWESAELWVLWATASLGKQPEVWPHPLLTSRRHLWKKINRAIVKILPAWVIVMQSSSSQMKTNSGVTKEQPQIKYISMNELLTFIGDTVQIITMLCWN